MIIFGSLLVGFMLGGLVSSWLYLGIIQRLEEGEVELDLAIMQCIRDQQNGLDVLASASWDNVREIWESK